MCTSQNIKKTELRVMSRRFLDIISASEHCNDIIKPGTDGFVVNLLQGTF